MHFSENLQKYLLEHKATIKNECEKITAKILQGDIWVEQPDFWEHSHIHWSEITPSFYRINLVIDATKNMPACPLIEVQYHLNAKHTDERVGVHIFEYHWDSEKLIFIDDFFIIHKRA